jgi:hypothetical protein
MSLRTLNDSSNYEESSCFFSFPLPLRRSWYNIGPSAPLKSHPIWICLAMVNIVSQGNKMVEAHNDSITMHHECIASASRARNLACTKQNKLSPRTSTRQLRNPSLAFVQRAEQVYWRTKAVRCCWVIPHPSKVQGFFFVQF